ncbi:hypothetical protein BpHYR1_012369 [Brachionus plicatilis]|uniref:Uncharacterized protein n=1 Tax=Brachionus plicatilis TaxID=10195 RepID=A0A3M7S1E8_BRAPC|nr:hypothetical protein BpHYR1_012369 [Brachionus plicatilis]
MVNFEIRFILTQSEIKKRTLSVFLQREFIKIKKSKYKIIVLFLLSNYLTSYTKKFNLSKFIICLKDNHFDVYLLTNHVNLSEYFDLLFNCYTVIQKFSAFSYIICGHGIFKSLLN